MTFAIERLQLIVQKLRHQTEGCEWDRMQTLQSLKAYTLEETYEIFDAIDKKDMSSLKQELGDLLFHIVFYADLANEQDSFNFNDVADAISDKLIARHPHLFARESTKKVNWEQLKQQERELKSYYSLVDDIPESMPALMRAEKIQKRCASVGFDWSNAQQVFDKVQEELKEVEAEINPANPNLDKISEEIGDLLFATVNLARHFHIHPEQCLQQANQKFIRRFKQVELLIKQQNLSLTDATLDMMENAWQQVKQSEKS